MISLLSHVGFSWAVEVGLEPRDLWVGMFWKRERNRIHSIEVLHLYVCPIPCVVVHALVRLPIDQPFDLSARGPRGERFDVEAN